MLDCIVIGGGPAGLTAAIYLARYHLDTRVIDAGKSRAEWIAKTRNHSGYPEGIAGRDLLAAMRIQAQKYGAKIVQANVTRIDKCDTGFVIEYGSGAVQTRTILLATGLVNRKPQIDEQLHEQGLLSGHIRYCPICDGYEVTDKAVGVIGTGSKGMEEAVFLRSYTADITLVAPTGAHELSEEDIETARAAQIKLVDGPAQVEAITDSGIVLSSAQGPLTFASIYPALGSDINSNLATMLGAKTSDVGCIVVDTHQRTSVPFLYAAGDVVIGLDQISHAMGEGGVAATTIRNDLAEQSPLYR